MGEVAAFDFKMTNPVEFGEQPFVVLSTNSDNALLLKESPGKRKCRRRKKMGRRHRRFNNLGMAITTLKCICCSRKMVVFNDTDTSPSVVTNTMEMCAKCRCLFPIPGPGSELLFDQRLPAPVSNTSVVLESWSNSLSKFDKQTSNNNFRSDYCTSSFSEQVLSDQKVSKHTRDGSCGSAYAFEQFLTEQFEYDYAQCLQDQISKKSKEELITDVKTLLRRTDELESLSKANKNSLSSEDNVRKDSLDELRLMREEHERLLQENSYLQKCLS